MRSPALVVPGLLLAMVSPSAGFAQDSDGDGVPDHFDDHPCDPSASGTAYAPAEGTHGAILFEDLWPFQGDLDFNDVVLTYSYLFRTNAAGQVVSLRATFNAIAAGGDYRNGLGWALPIPRSAVSRVTRSIGGGAPVELTPAADPQLTLTVSPDLRELFDQPTGAINSRPDFPRRDGALLVVDIELTAPVALSAGSAPYDVYIFRTLDPSYEIHLPEYAGTAAMNATLFGTGDDGSSSPRFFVDHRGLPFGLVLPTSDAYPREGAAIEQLFPDILGFAASAGATHRDFYESNVVEAFAYRDSLGQPPLTPVFGPLPAIDTSCLPAAPTASIVAYQHLDFFTVAEGGLVDSYQIGELAVDWDRDRAYLLRAASSGSTSFIRSFPISTMAEDQQARMSDVTSITPNHSPGTLHSDGEGFLYLVPGSGNSRPIMKIDATSYSEVARFGVTSTGLSNTTGRLVATTWMATIQSSGIGAGFLLVGSLFNDIAILRASDLRYVWGAGQSINESRVRGMTAGAINEGWILGSNRNIGHTTVALYHVLISPAAHYDPLLGTQGVSVTRVASFSPGVIRPGATGFYDQAGGLVYDATDGGLIFQVRIANGSSAGPIHTVKWRDGSIVWNVETPFMINYQGPFESQNRLTEPRWAQMRGLRVIQLDTRTGATLLNQQLPFAEAGAQAYDSVSNRLLVRTDRGWTRIQFGP